MSEGANGRDGETAPQSVGRKTRRGHAMERIKIRSAPSFPPYQPSPAYHPSSARTQNSFNCIRYLLSRCAS